MKSDDDIFEATYEKGFVNNQKFWEGTTPLKALLKLTIALSEAGELK